MSVDKDRLIETERILKALGNKRRLLIVKFLQTKGSADVGSIAEHLRLSFAATSRHMRVLANADLVESRQVNTTVNYSLPKQKNPSLNSALTALS